MNIILITSPDHVEQEHRLVEAMLGMGLRRLHLRKPGWTEEQVDEWLAALDPVWRERVVLHDWHHLAVRYRLGGVHLNGRNPELLPELRAMQQRGEFTVSRSCHSIGEVREAKRYCDYVTLSPIFDSISKEGYGAAFAPEEIKKAAASGLIDSNVYALGGVDLSRLDELAQMGFSSAALLGSIWQSSDPVAALRQWLLSCQAV